MATEESARLRAALQDRLDTIRSRIAAACRRAGRRPEDVVLVAVTKSVGVLVIEALIELGVSDIGEHRAIEGARKLASVRKTARRHFVGHIQTNKAARVVESFDVVHSVDRLSLAAELERRCASGGKVLPAFVQVNVSGEPTKGGFRPEETPSAVEALLGRLPHLNIRGLMTMAPADDASGARACFRRLRQLSESCGLAELSMGMSGDFEIAVEEGATHVRLGTVLFEGLESARSAAGPPLGIRSPVSDQ